MPGHRRPFTTALTALNAALGKARARRRARLPTIAALARAADVSKNTMLAAVRQAASQGRLTVAPGRGVLANLRASALRTALPAGRSVSGKRWEATAVALRQDLLSAAPADAGLPTAAGLAQRYGVCDRTMRKVLRRLVSERALALRHGRYVRPGLAARPHATIVLLARGQLNLVAGGREAVLSPIAPRTQENLRSLEHYCVQHSIQLQHVPCFFDGAGPQTGLGSAGLDRLLRSRPVVGALLWTMALPPEWSLDLVQRLRLAGLRVAVLDEVATLRDPQALAALPGVRYYRLGCGSDDGLTAGRWLLRQGHRKAAFITGWPEQDWSANRYAGVCQAFAEAGLAGAVELFPAADLENVPHEERVLSDVRGVLDRALATRVRDADGQVAPSDGNAPLFDDLKLAVGRGLLRRRLEPALQAAARRPDLTAWVAANDPVGLLALEFLRRRRVDVPGRLSLLGFDDTVEATYRGLSSFNFNGPALVRAMVDFVVGGERHTTARSVEEVQVEGFVVERGTTGRA